MKVKTRSYITSMDNKGKKFHNSYQNKAQDAQKCYVKAH